MDRIGELSPTSDRYIEVMHEKHMAVVFHSSPTYAHIAVYKVRRDRLPTLEDEGVLSPLPIAPHQNLGEPTHLIFFNRNVVGIMKNTRESPGRIPCAMYLTKLLAPFNYSVLLTPILRPDVLQMLSDGRFARATVRVATGNIDAISQDAPSLRSAARQVADATSSGSVEITVRPGKSAQEKREFWDKVKNLFTNIRNYTGSGALEKLEVSIVDDGTGVQVVDLLGDDLSERHTVELPDSGREIEERVARQVILDAYTDLEPQVSASLALDVTPPD